MVMESHTEPSRTEMTAIEIEFDSSRVNDRLFTTAYLRKIKG